MQEATIGMDMIRLASPSFRAVRSKQKFGGDRSGSQNTSHKTPHLSCRCRRAGGRYTAGETGMIANRRKNALTRQRRQPPACGIEIRRFLLLAFVSHSPSASVLQRRRDLQIHHTMALLFTRNSFTRKLLLTGNTRRRGITYAEYRRSLWPKRGRERFADLSTLSLARNAAFFAGC
jgi:hypothetical protein